MTKRKQALLAAVMSTLCAVIWLANCVVDVACGLESPGQIVLHVLCTVIWTVCAAIWWVSWRRQRLVGSDAQT